MQVAEGLRGDGIVPVAIGHDDRRAALLPTRGLVLGDAALDIPDIRQGVRTLARAVASQGGA